MSMFSVSDHERVQELAEKVEAQLRQLTVEWGTSG